MLIRVAIIDDNAADSNLLRRFISKLNFWQFEIFVFHADSDFFEFIQKNQLDIVFVDYLLGKQNGIDLIAKSKDLKLNVPFVLLTGFGNEDLVRKALRAGASDYLNKNELSLDLIEKTIRHLLEKREGDEKLQFTQNMLQTLIEKTETSLIVLDKKGFVQDVNNVFLALIQQPNEKLVKERHISDWISPESQHKIIHAIDECLQTGSISNLELPMQNNFDSEIFMLINGVLMKKQGKNHIYLMMRDISARKKYEQELKLAKIKAEEADRLKSAFLANLSHEIRTPLNAIIGFSELITDENLSSKQKKECAVHLKDGSETLLNLINDIIEVSKIVARQIEVNKSAFNVNSILDDLFLNITRKKEYTKKNQIEISIKKSIPDPGFIILSDAFRLKQILGNLLDNALKFTEKGTIEFGYSVKENKFLEFFVQDTGIGISPEKLNVIFDWFRKAGDSENKLYRGSGIGLTISYSLVGLLGGELSVKSVVGKGSLFKFHIPLQIPEFDNQKKNSTQNPTEIRPDFGGKTILIAEDEDTNFHFLKVALGKHNFKIIRAKTGQEALDIVQKNAIDIVLMDIKMPVMDGYAATNAIKHIYPKLPIIAQTAYAMHNEKEKILEAGCDDYISKPISVSALIDIIYKNIAS